MKYILLNKERTRVAEIIPEYNPAFPDFPLEKRYSTVFIASLLPVSDDTAVEAGWYYDANTGGFLSEAPEEKSDPDVYDELALAFTEGVNSIDQ